MADPDVYRETMSRLASGLTVVATRDPAGKPVGLLVQAIFSLAVDPPRLLISVGTTSRTLPSLLARRSFSVNVLGGPEADRLRARFASTADDKFAGLSWHPADPRYRDAHHEGSHHDGAGHAGTGPDGPDRAADVPVLTAGVTATLVCRLEEHFTRHDHVLLIAEPLHANPGPVAAGESAPLICYRHEFHPLRPGPADARAAATVSAPAALDTVRACG